MNYLKALLVTAMVMLSTPVLADVVSNPPATSNPDLSGAWYDPSQPGWGLLIDEGMKHTFVAWFTYQFYTEDIEQAWYVGATPVGDYKSILMARPYGAFPSEGYDEGDPVANLVLEPQDDGTLAVGWKFFDEFPCVSPRVSPSPTFCSGSALLERAILQP